MKEKDLIKIEVDLEIEMKEENLIKIEIEVEIKVAIEMIEVGLKIVMKKKHRIMVEIRNQQNHQDIITRETELKIQKGNLNIDEIHQKKGSQEENLKISSIFMKILI